MVQLEELGDVLSLFDAVRRGYDVGEEAEEEEEEEWNAWGEHGFGTLGVFFFSFGEERVRLVEEMG